MHWIVRRVGADEFFGADKVYASTIDEAGPFADVDDAQDMQRACSDVDTRHFYEIEEVSHD